MNQQNSVKVVHSFNLGARVGNCNIMRPRARANLRANTYRGNVHCKQNCFGGVLLFKTLFAEFCVKSGRKTEPWNWAVRDKKLITMLFSRRF